ncbi:response regulator [Stieleria varia]|uniref:Response regulator rcp1 n=1 Tax=Stieleria varia TaxID=2528005 RepID=A0A5C6AGP0_9BACT|nr:response regulator [Stieleria varia]TWT98355.1 Response regulator rcp1 [Stieleria varia]
MPEPKERILSPHLLTFLLVEDDDNHAHLVMRSLQKARVQNRVFRVSDGAEALAFLRSEGDFADTPHPDVVLLDLNLPKLSGHEVLAIIKQDEHLKTIPVVVMTTSDAESDRVKAYEHHANSYVVKPLDFDRFRELVRDLCLYWGVWNEPPEGE